MKYALIFIAALVMGCSTERPTNKPANKWITNVLEYSPAPGQFVNSGLGSQTSPNSIVGKRGIVTLGGYGGYIVFKFGQPVKNGTGVDFVIHGNAFYGSSEPGIVMVSVDANKNGIADDKWVELIGSNHSSATQNYTINYAKPASLTNSQPVAWSDNKGGSGFIKTTAPNVQPYWPLWHTDATISLSGNRISNPALVENNLWVLPALGNGYVDNFSSDFTQVINGDNDTQNSNKFDLDAAAEPMQSADFIKVYTAVNEDCELLGEASTEICGAIIINH